MKRTIVAGVVASLVVIGAGVSLVRTVSAQAPACRRGNEQSPAEVERRRVAVNLMRAINTTQASFSARNGRYGTFEELGASPTPLPTGDFATSVVTSGKHYSVLIRDMSDACGYTLFSDERGLIFIGAPMQ
jgi:hypothetical protein